MPQEKINDESILDTLNTLTAEVLSARWIPDEKSLPYRLYERNYHVTLPAVREQFELTGRFEALRAKWREGDPNPPHIFWESDVAKWMEAAAYYLKDHDDSELENFVDEIVDCFARYQQPSGYLNLYFTVVEPGQAFQRRTDHELYCAGHLLEAAIAYDECCHKPAFLEIMLRYVDYIDQVFRVEHSAAFDTPGHQEIELALLRLYHYKGQEKHLRLAKYFLDQRGVSEKDTTYDFADMEHLQSHLPVLEQTTAEGHAVRLLYQAITMAKLGQEAGNEAYGDAARILMQNIVRKRMYHTGAVGSTHLGESFTYDYDLPQATAYGETCASIALVMLCRELNRLEPRGEWGDAAELALYNTVLGSESLKGDAFFYENPPDVDLRDQRFNASRPEPLRKHLPIMERVRVFPCSCCPPNLCRFFASLDRYAYQLDPAQGRLYCHHYMPLELSFRWGLDDSERVILLQNGNYPEGDEISFEVLQYNTQKPLSLFLRLPGWCQDWTLSLNGINTDCPIRDGFLALPERLWQEGDRIELRLERAVRVIHPSPHIPALSGRVILQDGPFVLCAEGVDQEGALTDLRLKLPLQLLDRREMEIQGKTVPCYEVAAVRLASADPKSLYSDAAPLTRPDRLTLIPFYARLNRGACDVRSSFYYSAD